LKKLSLVAFFYFILTAAFCQGQPYWQQKVDYKIDVTLNDADNTLDGFIKMEYYNNSPDTLTFIWIHLWPNAYKNDKTAFTDQQLENGSTGFYFSNDEQRGYINRLDFKVNNITARTEDHPQHQDIIKLLLPQPLPPNTSCKIQTPFHVKLPYNFSRSGYKGQAYSITQWYPKPAVYDSKGWHPIPYLDQGEFYSEFGDYKVQITLPDNYKLAATGELQNEEYKTFLSKNTFAAIPPKEKAPVDIFKRNKPKVAVTPSSKRMMTVQYEQKNVHDFAWFADKNFSTLHDTLQLPSGRIINVYAFYYAKNEALWKNSIAMIKRALLTKSKWIGEYPYNVATVVDEDKKDGGGMEYPTITLLSAGETERSLDFVINHELGHNWFYGILATNEREHPWMDEGINTYYDNRYAMQQYGTISDGTNILNGKSTFIKNRMPDDASHTFLESVIAVKQDQPIETPSEKFSAINYALVAYTKTGEWMQLLEQELGKPLFDSCMKVYYERWQFRHPYPEDFKRTVEEVSGRNLDATFSLLYKKGELKTTQPKKDIKLAFLFSLKDTDKHNYIFASPMLGYNFYDKLMIGGLIHNYTLPATKFQFVISPLYATNSKQLNGIGRVSYSWFPGNNGQKVELALSGASFSGDSFTDSVNNTTFLRFSKLVPSVKYVFANKNPRSTIVKYLQAKTFLIKEKGLLFTRDTIQQVDVITYPVRSRYVNQLQFVIQNNRVLYPYQGTLQVEQGKDFARLNFTGNYFFNYAKGGGVNVRLFAGKFFYLGDKTFTKEFETDIYHLNMTGAKGYEDYTYSNYFYGRNEFEGGAAQQIMIRDGGFKVRTDLLANKIGKTDDWLAAVNATSTIPSAINPLELLPIKIPLKVFVDVGTYADAWKKNAATGRFLYDAGLQLSVLNVVNIYVPLLYSKVYDDYFKSTIPTKRFLKNISFSIDIQDINLRRMLLSKL